MINGSLVNSTSFSDDFPELHIAERAILFIYILIILVVSTLGNTFVLAKASDLKSVTKDSKGSILLINVAFVDLVFNVFLTFPMLVSSLSKSWILGSVYCFLDAFFETYLGILEMMFIFLIAIHRATVIKFPFKQQRLLNTKRMWGIVGFTYVYCTFPAIVRVVATTQIMGYLPEELHCDNLEVANVQPWQAILTISLVLYAAIPVIGTVILYIWMMVFAISKSEHLSRSESGNHKIKKKEGVQMKAPNKAFTTVSMIIGVYLISISLTLILIVVRIGMSEVPKRAHLAATCLWLFNTAANPIIYVYNNPAFRAHIRRWWKRKQGIPTWNSSSYGGGSTRRGTKASIMSLSIRGSPRNLRKHNQPERVGTATSLVPAHGHHVISFSRMDTMGVLEEAGGEGTCAVFENKAVLMEANGTVLMEERDCSDDSESDDNKQDGIIHTDFEPASIRVGVVNIQESSTNRSSEISEESKSDIAESSI